MKRWVPLLVLAWACAFQANAHEVRPAYLELRQSAPDTYDVLWKVPALGDDRRLGIYVRLPDDAKKLSEPRGFFSDNAYVERWRVRRAGGLDGQTIRIDGLAATRIDVLVRVERAGGVTQTARLLPDSPNFASPPGEQSACLHSRQPATAISDGCAGGGDSWRCQRPESSREVR